MMASVMVQIDAGVDGAVAEVLDSRSSTTLMVMGRGMTSAVTVHYAKGHGGSQGDYERYCKVVDYYCHLFIADVVRQDDGAVLTGVVTGELHSFDAVRIRKICTHNCRWITTSFDVNKQHCIICPVRSVTGVVVAYVYVCTVIKIARAPFSTGTPAAVCEANKFLTSRGNAGHRLRHKIGS